MSHHTYPPTPELEARNAARRAAGELLDSLASSDGHAYRARTRLAADHPPPAIPTDDAVRAAVAATAPGDAAELAAVDAMLRRPKLTVVR